MGFRRSWLTHARIRVLRTSISAGSSVQVGAVSSHPRVYLYSLFLNLASFKLRDTAPNFSVGTEPPGRDRDGERGLGHGSARTRWVFWRKRERSAERRERAVCGARVRKCVASLGAAAAARPRCDGENNPRPCPCLCTYAGTLFASSWGALFPVRTGGEGCI